MLSIRYRYVIPRGRDFTKSTCLLVDGPCSGVINDEYFVNYCFQTVKVADSTSVDTSESSNKNSGLNPCNRNSLLH